MASPPTHDAWRYARSADDGSELAFWRGASAPLLGCHFHHEAQLCCVLSGSRLFEIGGQRMQVLAGQCLLIPAGVPHRSLAHVDGGTACINLYMAPRGTAALPPTLAVRALGETLSISEIAASAGLRRESFTRQFTRRMGMPPHAYRLALKLNAARQRLREGAASADLAAELGFADQSHLGRHFRRMFGVSPRAYRDGMREPAPASQTF